MNVAGSKQSIVGRVTLLVCVAAVGAQALSGQDIPSRPEDLAFRDLGFEVPRAESIRHELSDGVVVYAVEDHTLPLVDIGLQLRTGSFLESAEKTGLAKLTGALLRSGGTTTRAPGELDEEIDALAANIRMSIGDTSASANLNCLTAKLDECLTIFFDMLENPRFDEERLELEKSILEESLAQRNDDPARLSGREWQWLLYGEEHFSSRQITTSTLEAIEREDLVAFHRNHWGPAGMVVTVSGDIKSEVILNKLGQKIAAWPSQHKKTPWPPPAPDYNPRPGVYSVEKDIPQGRVQIGHLGIQRSRWDDPAHFALQVMNSILGGGGFTSRLMKRIRSDEGLAYSAGSSFDIASLYWPGTFRIFFQSKSESVALATQIAIEEIHRLRSEEVSDEELETAKSSFIETLPRRFDSPRSVTTIFATDEILGRSHAYWYDYRKNLGAVTKAEILQVARKYLDPDKLILLIVGNWEAIAKGDPGGRASMTDILEGAVNVVPPRDPLTLEPLSP